ncbi:MAG: hypothetical protein WKF84_02845 [Pyrinomonadaceae bacterium]
MRLIDRTDENIIREHWRGSIDVVNLVDALAAVGAAYSSAQTQPSALFAR